MNVGLQGRFAEYAGDVVRPDQRIVLVCDPGTEMEARVRLGRIGYDLVAGHLQDPMRVFLEHPSRVEASSRLSPTQLAASLAEMPELVVLDVRNTGELDHGAIPGSAHVPMASLIQRLGELDPSVPTVVYCAGGYRSSMAASLLAARGFADVSDLLGGFDGWLIATEAKAG